MPRWTRQQTPQIRQPNRLLLTRRTQLKLRTLFKHQSIQQAYLKFAETVFAAMEEPVTGCPEKARRPVTARSILPELSARKVRLKVWAVRLFQLSALILILSEGARKSSSFKESLTSAALSPRACQQTMLVNICRASFANTFHYERERLPCLKNLESYELFRIWLTNWKIHGSGLNRRCFHSHPPTFTSKEKMPMGHITFSRRS